MIKAEALRMGNLSVDTLLASGKRVRYGPSVIADTELVVLKTDESSRR